MQTALASLFQALQLKQEHSKLYLGILEHPQLPASRLASLCGCKRGHTYNLLSDLLAQGLIEESQEAGPKRFRARAPSLLQRKLREQAQSFNEVLKEAEVLLPLLESMAPRNSQAPRVQLFRGAEGLKDLYESTLSCQEGVIAGVGDFSHIFPVTKGAELNRWLWNYAKRRAQRGIWYHGILSRSSESDRAYLRRKTEKRKLKLMEDVEIRVEVNIFDDKLSISSSKDDMMGVLIQSQSIATSAKALHALLWRLLPDYRQT